LSLLLPSIFSTCSFSLTMKMKLKKNNITNPILLSVIQNFSFKVPASDAKLATGKSHDAQLFQREQKLMNVCQNAINMPVSTSLPAILKVLRLLRPNERKYYFPFESILFLNCVRVLLVSIPVYIAYGSGFGRMTNWKNNLAVAYPDSYSIKLPLFNLLYAKINFFQKSQISSFEKKNNNSSLSKLLAKFFCIYERTELPLRLRLKISFRWSIDLID